MSYRGIDLCSHRRPKKTELNAIEERHLGKKEALLEYANDNAKLDSSVIVKPNFEGKHREILYKYSWRQSLCSMKWMNFGKDQLDQPVNQGLVCDQVQLDVEELKSTGWAARGIGGLRLAPFLSIFPRMHTIYTMNYRDNLFS